MKLRTGCMVVLALATLVGCAEVTASEQGSRAQDRVRQGGYVGAGFSTSGSSMQGVTASSGAPVTSDTTTQETTESQRGAYIGAGF